MRFKQLILLAGLANLDTPSTAQMLSARDPQGIAAFMREKGYQAELQMAAEGADGPQIKSGAGGTQFTIFFRNCTAGANCTTISFFTGFTDVDGVPLERINSWNAQNRFARAFIDSDQDPVIILDVDLDHQGIARENFGEYLAIWSDLAPKYLNYLRASAE